MNRLTHCTPRLFTTGVIFLIITSFITTYAFANEAITLDPAVKGYIKVSGVSGNVNSIGSDTLNNDIPRMGNLARMMVKESIDAFVKDDATLARKVLTDDDFVDNLMEQLFRELLSFMLEDPRTISRAIRLSFIAKYLERMADHATNIAELVVYLVEGKIIRHTAPPVSS